MTKQPDRAGAPDTIFVSRKMFAAGMAVLDAFDEDCPISPRLLVSRVFVAMLIAADGAVTIPFEEPKAILLEACDGSVDRFEY